VSGCLFNFQDTTSKGANTLQTTHTAPRQSWIVLTALFAFASFLEVVLFSHLFAFTPLFLQNIGFDAEGVKFWTGILASSATALGFWFVPFWGVLADRYGRKILILRSFAIEAISTAIMAFSFNIWVFLFGRTIIGLNLGNTGLMLATLTDQAPKNRVGLAISLVTGSQPLGVVIGSVVGGLIVSRWGVPVLFGIDATMVALLTVGLSVFYRETFIPTRVHPIAHMLRESIRAVLTTPIVVMTFTFSFLATVAFFSSYTYLSARIVELSGNSDSGSTIGIVFGVAGIATLIATPVWGALADRFGHRRVLPIVSVLTALFYVPLYFAMSLQVFTAELFLLYSVSSAVNSVTFAIIGLYTPVEKRGAVMSMIFMPLNLGSLFAPALAAVLAREVRDVFLFSALFAFLAFVMVYFVDRRVDAQPVIRHEPS
jgi:MFS family permease